MAAATVAARGVELCMLLAADAREAVSVAAAAAAEGADCVELQVTARHRARRRATTGALYGLFNIDLHQSRIDVELKATGFVLRVLGFGSRAQSYCADTRRETSASRVLLQSLQLETAATARGHCADTVREISAGSVPPDQAWAREERLFQQLSLNGLFKCPRGYSSIEVRVSARRWRARRTHHCPAGCAGCRTAGARGGAGGAAGVHRGDASQDGEPADGTELL